MLNLTIDGKRISCKEGTKLLDAALENGIYIPNLCHHPDLKPLGGCRLCVVEVDGTSEPVTSCETEARDGMIVTTSSPRLEKIRTLALELVLSHHPSTCTECPKYGKCELQSMLLRMGITNNRLYPLPNKRLINEKNPLIVHEPLRCIKCGRCVRVCRDVRGVDVLNFHRDEKNGEVYVCEDGILADKDCRFCGACIEVCPTSALRDAAGVIRTDIPREQALIPCSSECPAHIDIPAYIRAVREGDCAAAHAIIREKVPFPHTLGYVCNNRCETACRRKSVNESISIRGLKRFAVEHDESNLWRQRGLQKPRTGKRVAVIGAGPCGMTAAYYLNKCGHDVTVYEKRAVAGGHMTGGIPEFRLPLKDVQEELDVIIDSGIQMVYDTEIQNACELKEQYDAVLVAVGTSVGKKLRSLPGAELGNVYTAIEFLQAVRRGEQLSLGETVNVIGGGSVGFDTARTAIRLGKKANIVCLEKNASQTPSEEVQEALEEGVSLFDCHSNEAILGVDGYVTGLQVHRVRSFGFSAETGKLEEDPEPDSTYVIPCDSVIFATGQETGLKDTFGIELNRFGYPVDPATGKSGRKTSVEGIFAAGDAITGISFVINAIAEGRAAASEIDSFLGGDGNIDEALVPRGYEPKIGKIEGFAKLPRERVTLAPADQRAACFMPVCNSFEEAEADRESLRCLQCDLRTQISKCRLSSDFFDGMEGG